MSSSRRREDEVRRPPVPRLVRRAATRSRRPGSSGDAELIWHGERDLSGADAIDRARRLLLRRLPARRRDRALLAGDGVGRRASPPRAASCSASATASRCCARRSLLPGALLRNVNLRFTCRQVELEVRARRTAPFTLRLRAGRTPEHPRQARVGALPRDEPTLARIEPTRPVRAALRARRELQRLAARHRRRLQRARQRVRPDAPPRARRRRAHRRLRRRPAALRSMRLAAEGARA